MDHSFFDSFNDGGMDMEKVVTMSDGIFSCICWFPYVLWRYGWGGSKQDHNTQIHLIGHAC